MIQADLSSASTFLSDREFAEALTRAESSLERVRAGTGPGSELLGWRTMLAKPNDAVLEQIDTLASEIRADADVFILCGIGGSYLGARAVIEALSPPVVPQEPEILYAGHHMDGAYLKDLIRYLERPGKGGEPRRVWLNVVSKSGSTLETALSFRVLRQWMHRRYGGEAKKRIVCTTGKTGGVLNELVETNGYRKLVIPDDVGGRFSVLTPVGLLPVAAAGIDVRTLFYGAVSEYDRLETGAGGLLDYAATRYALYGKGIKIDVIGSFEPGLNYLSKWLQQLLGESEGKEGKGLFPVAANYSTDLHSLGQLIQQGERNLMETILTVGKKPKGILVEEDKDNPDGLDYLSGKTLYEINAKALEGTLAAHTKGEIPAVTVKLGELNEQSLGEFIYFYELFTAVYCYCLGVNPFNQPGVEAYKKAMYKLLGK